MANGYDEYDPYGYNEYPSDWGSGLPEMSLDSSFGESLGAGVISGIADLGLPAMGFGLMAANEAGEMWAENRMEQVGEWGRRNPNARGPRRWLGKFQRSGMLDIGGIRPGWRMGQRVGRALTFGRMGTAGSFIRGGFGLGGAAMGFGISMLPLMAIDVGVGYLSDNLMEGAESYYHSNRMMEQIGSMSSIFGEQSTLDGGSGFGSDAIRSWTLGGGIESISQAAGVSDLGREGVTNMAGFMAGQGMLGSFRSPEEFMTKFRNKLQQVQQLSQILDVSIGEATQVMSTLNQAGLSQDAQLNLGKYASTISALTGQSFGSVMNQGLAGAGMAAQLGLSPDQGAGLAMANLSTASVLSGLGALDPGLMARLGGAEGVAGRMTEISLQMTRTQGGQDLLARLVDSSGSTFDLERLEDAIGGTRRGRRRLDPYALDDLAGQFRENEAAIVEGQIGRLRARYGEGRDFNRAQYRFLRELGIDDPQEQLAYLQNMRTSPMMQILESQQQRRDDALQDPLAGYSRENWFQRNIARTFEDIGETLEETIGEPVRRFGQRFAQAMEDAGNFITEFLHGRPSTDIGPVSLGPQAMSDYARDIWGGNPYRSTSFQEVVDYRRELGMPAEEDRRGWLGRNRLFGAAPDTRFAARVVQAIETGQISEEQIQEFGIEFYRNLRGRNPGRYERAGRLLNEDPVDFPDSNHEGWIITADLESNLALRRFMSQQGYGANMRQVEWFGRQLEGSLGNRMRSQIAEATEGDGSRGFYSSVGQILGYGGDRDAYDRMQSATIERIAQEYMPSHIRRRANISSRGMTGEEFNAQGVRGATQQMFRNILGDEMTRSMEREIGGAIGTQEGRDYLQFLASESAAGSALGIDLQTVAQGYQALIGQYGEDRAALSRGVLFDFQLERLLNDTSIPEELRERLQSVQNMGPQGRNASGVSDYGLPHDLGGAIIAAQDQAISEASRFIDSHTDEEATARLVRVTERGSGLDALTDTDLADRWLAAGLNPTASEDRAIVESFAQGIGRGGASEAFADIGEMEGMDDIGWTRVYRGRRERLRQASGVSESTSEILGERIGGAANRLSDLLQATESSEISAARSRVLVEQAEGIRDQIERRLGAFSGGAQLGEDAAYFLEVMSGRGLSIGEAGMPNLENIVAAQGARDRRRLIAQRRAELGLGEGDVLGQEHIDAIDAQVRELNQSFRDQLSANTNQDLTLELALEVAGARMANRGLDAEEREIIRELGPGGQPLIQLSEMLYGERRGTQEQIANLLSTSPYGQQAMDEILNQFTEAGSKDRDVAIEELASQLRGGGETAQNIFSTIVGRAVSSGFLSTDLMENKAREAREVDNAEHLANISSNMSLLGKAVTEVDGEPAIRVED